MVYMVIDIILIEGDKGQSYVRDRLKPHIPEIIAMTTAITIICNGDFATSLAPAAGMISNAPIRKAPINFMLTDITRASISSIANSIL